MTGTIWCMNDPFINSDNEIEGEKMRLFIQLTRHKPYAEHGRGFFNIVVDIAKEDLPDNFDPFAITTANRKYFHSLLPMTLRRTCEITGILPVELCLILSVT